MNTQVESLEPRTLLSGSWNTVDDYLYGTRAGLVQAITVSGSGQIYAAGSAVAGSLGAGEAHELLRTSTNGGATWSLLSDYRVPGARSSTISDIEVDGAGNIFIAGSAAPAGSSETLNWFVRRSADAGQTWTTVDTVGLGGGSNVARDLTIDAAGNIYAVGRAESGIASNCWLVRRSADGGNTWATVDVFSAGTGVASSVFVHPTAGVFVAGQSGIQVRKSTSLVWTVRRSGDGGNTWATVDSFAFGSYVASASGLGADAAGNLYTVGSASSKSGSTVLPRWVVRKSTNGGSTWTTVDDYQPNASASGNASRFARDSAGNLFVAGTTAERGGNPKWTVRMSAGGTGAWSTVDQFQLVSGSTAEARAIAADPSGRVFVAGTANGTSGPYHWIVRRYSPASAAAPGRSPRRRSRSTIPLRRMTRPSPRSWWSLRCSRWQMG